jgi:hypothetical protein
MCSTTTHPQTHTWFTINFGLNYLGLVMAHDHIYYLFIFEARRALWAPRSVGPYGVGRAPTPLMHAPVGACIWAPPWGAHYRSRLFLFCRSSALRAPGSNGCPKGHPYAPPSGGALMGHPKGCPICAPLRGAHYITRVRVCACT